MKVSCTLNIQNSDSLCYNYVRNFELFSVESYCVVPRNYTYRLPRFCTGVFCNLQPEPSVRLFMAFYLLFHSNFSDDLCKRSSSSCCEQFYYYAVVS